MTPSPPPHRSAAKKANSHTDLALKISGIINKFKQKKEEYCADFLADGNKRDDLAFPNNIAALTDKTLSDLALALANADNIKADNLPCLTAVGGYGRKELAPFSDVDVLFLTENALTAADKNFIERLTAAFWDTGMKLSHSVRTLEDCALAMTQDLHFATSLLEKRYIFGDKDAFKRMDTAFRAHIAAATPGAFIAAKLAEQEARHRKMGDSRYRLQPNVKESKGALRDIQTLLWLSNFLYRIETPEALAEEHILTAPEAETLKRARRFFWRIRCHLHLLAGRADDRLSFDSQPEIALRMGYAEKEPNLRAESFMRDYFLMANETGNLTRILCADLEARALPLGGTAGTRKIALADVIDGFPVLHNRLTVSSARHFHKTPADMLRIFRVSQTAGHDIHPDALRAIRNTLKKGDAGLQKTPEACRIFCDILLDAKKAEQTLRRLNEADVLTALLPDFGNIRAHMQYDMYHVYTADEHTIRAVGMMHKIENGDLAESAPLATQLFKKIHSRRALYAAMFLHDIAKGTGGRHSEKGAEIAKNLCPRLGLTGEETETVIWLVENHLLMTMTALKRDLNDDKTIADFVAAVQSPERLKLLTVLTAADIMAVGPDRWNNWKAGLLAELYHKSSAHMSGAPRDREQNEQFIILQKQVRRKIGDRARTLQYLADYAPRYFWLSFSADAVAQFVAALHKNIEKENPQVIRISPDKAQDYTEVFVFARDRKGLFAELSGAMAVAGASIVEARIFTLTNGMALDVFQVQGMDGHAYENGGYLQKTILRALAGKIDLDAEIAERQKAQPGRGRHFSAQPRVIIDNDASNSSTVIEVNGKDRPGFLHRITAALTQAGLQISAAKVTTFGSRAVDVFYVKDAFGLKIIHPQKLRMIEQSLLAALGDKNGPHEK
jgi:[protein-PII] uridylyltransferase